MPLKQVLYFNGHANGISDFNDVYSGGIEMIDSFTLAKQKN